MKLFKINGTIEVIIDEEIYANNIEEAIEKIINKNEPCGNSCLEGHIVDES